ncbi:MAG TPA: hypothetical protein VIP77_23785 [Jiangellaceae bacterium]
MTTTPAAGLGPGSPTALFHAPEFDGHDEHGRPRHDRPRVHPQERNDVLAYLEDAPVVLAARSLGPDALKPDDAPVVPRTFHTDGTWVWSGAVAHYLRAHYVPPVPQLVQHIRDHAYQVPPVDPDGLDAATAVVTGQVPGSPLPEYRPRVISEAEQRVLDHLRDRLDHHGVGPREYGIVEAKPEVLVLEPAPGPDGWQVQFWDLSRGPTGRPTVYRHVADAAKVLLAELLWRDDADEAREARRSSERGRVRQA